MESNWVDTFEDSALERRDENDVCMPEHSSGREHVGFDLPLLGQEVIGGEVRKYSGPGSIFDLSFTYNLSHFFRVL